MRFSNKESGLNSKENEKYNLLSEKQTYRCLIVDDGHLNNSNGFS